MQFKNIPKNKKNCAENVMTEDIIKKITEAEEEAANIKASATQVAADKIANAELRAAEVMKTSDEVCKAYRETALKNAEISAQKEYDEAIKKAETDARNYCAEILLKSDTAAAVIVGRIIGGNR